MQKLGAAAMASFFLGGFINAIVLTPVAYFLVYKFVRSHRRRISNYFLNIISTTFLPTQIVHPST